MTWRALLVGSAAVAALSAISIHCTLTLQGSLHCWDYFLAAPIFLLLIVMGLSGLAGLAAPCLRLRRGELGAVFMMLLAGAPIASIGFVTRLIPAMGGLKYYATAENQWARLLFPHVPRWAAPRNIKALDLLFEGLPDQGGIPWGEWALPLAFWGAFFIALAVLSVCLAVLLRKQWIERERLAYPIMALTVELLNSGERPGERSFWRSRLLWLGLWFAFVMAGLEPLSRYLDAYYGLGFNAPKFDTHWVKPSGGSFLRFKLSWSIMALTYLIPQDVALSVWLFNLIYQLQGHAYAHLGVDMADYREMYVWGGPAFSGQAIGAFLFVGVSSFWLGRRHLAEVWRSAFSRRRHADDAREIMPYRVACWGTMVSFVVTVGFLAAMGTPVWLGVLVLLAAIFCMVAITKIAIQCGLGWLNIPMPPPTMVTTVVGTQILAPASVVSLGPNFIWTSPMRLTELGTISHGLKVADQAPMRRRGLFTAILVAVVVGLLSAYVFHMRLAHTKGGVNFYGWFYRSYAQRPWQYAEGKLTAPHPPRWRALGFIGMGAGMAGAMQVLRNQFIWWPFSVVGFAAAHLTTTRKFWFSMFLVWLVKGSLVRYGGQRAYRTGRPFFLGLFLGHTLAKGTWYLLSLLTDINGSVRW